MRIEIYQWEWSWKKRAPKYLAKINTRQTEIPLRKGHMVILKGNNGLETRYTVDRIRFVVDTGMNDYFLRAIVSKSKQEGFP